MSPGVLIRPYQPSDRKAVRHLCCETGYLGGRIDPVFEDRELFADYLTKYYTDWEPESSFVLEQDGEVKGYLLGSCRPGHQQFFDFFNNLNLFARGMVKYPFYRRPTRNFILWILFKSWREVPQAPRGSAHFHFNILPEAQGLAHSRKLMNTYFAAKMYPRSLARLSPLPRAAGRLPLSVLASASWRKEKSPNTEPTTTRPSTFAPSSATSRTIKFPKTPPRKHQDPLGSYPKKVIRLEIQKINNQ